MSLEEIKEFVKRHRENTHNFVQPFTQIVAAGKTTAKNGERADGFKFWHLHGGIGVRLQLECKHSSRSKSECKVTILEKSNGSSYTVALESFLTGVDRLGYEYYEINKSEHSSRVNNRYYAAALNFGNLDIYFRAFGRFGYLSDNPRVDSNKHERLHKNYHLLRDKTNLIQKCILSIKAKITKKMFIQFDPVMPSGYPTEKDKGYNGFSFACTNVEHNWIIIQMLEQPSLPH